VSQCDYRSGALLATVALATVLWFVTFYISWGIFWFKIAFSAASLASIAWWSGSLRDQALRFDVKAWLNGLVSAAALYLLFWSAKALATVLFSFAHDQIGAIYGKGEGTPMWIIILLLFFVTGPSEEIYWRGYLQRQLMLRFGGWQGWLLATIIYAGVHLWSFNFMLIAAAGVAGAFWGAMYWRLGKLGQVIISHSLWSSVIFAVFPMS
jgi:membrane protease YdiL (CAAX protease family)